MKTATITLGIFASFVAAQSVPQCGQFCVDDMLNDRALELDCENNDLACLCADERFTFGLRDCSSATCGSDDARRVVEHGVQLCRDAGVEITDAPGGGSGGSGSVSTIYSSLTADGSAVTTAVATTTFGAGSPSPTASGSGGAGGLVSTITTDGSTIVTTLSPVSSGTETPTGNVVSTTISVAPSESPSSTDSGNTSEGGEETATDTDGAAETTEAEDAAIPMRTAAPAGIIAAAGLAVLML